MSAKDSIITLPNPHLRQKSTRIAQVDQKILDTVAKMKAAALDWESTREHELGVALAAIQIDEAVKVIIVRENFDDKSDKRFSVFINPEITKLEGEIEEDFEGCLSVADVYGRVPRHTKVRVRALDESGQPIRIKAEGFLARVLQHEIDHTKGKMFVDYLIDKPDHFYKLTPEGELKNLPYEQVQAAGIFRE